MKTKKILTDKKQAMLVPLIAIVASLIVGALAIWLVGKDPVEAYHALLQGSGILPKQSYAAYKGMLTDFMSFLNALTPMIFTSLAVTVAFKAGLFNIGVSGQMLVAGFMATILVGYSDLSSFVAKPLVILIGMVCGALVGALIGYLKYRFNINEVVSSIMINYIVQYVISFCINMFYIDTVSRQSRAVSQAASLTLKSVEAFGYKMDVPLGIILAVIVTCLVKVVLDRTKLGYEIKTVGANRQAAQYAGIRVGRTLVIAMLLSGALAGLAGVTLYLGLNGSIQPRVLSSYGYDGIAVSLLGNATPFGGMAAAGLVTIITKGATYMRSIAGVPQEMAALITGLMLLFSACGAYIHYLMNTVKRRQQEKEIARGAKRTVDSKQKEEA